MMSTFARALSKIVPPGGDDQVTSWRLWVFVFLAVLLLNGVAGRGGFWGIGAYAAAGDVKELLQLQYSELILQHHRLFCEAKDEASKAVLRRSREAYQLRYRELTGDRLPLPPCEKK